MKSIASRILPFAVAACTLVATSGIAFADALPEDACESSAAVGASCNNAGDHFDEPGTCTNETCQSSHPDPDAGDGGFTTTTYDCVLCEVGDGGSSTSDGGGATTTRPDGGDGSTSSSSSSSSCSFSPGDRDGAAGFGMLALGLIGLAVTRKQTKNKKR